MKFNAWSTTRIRRGTKTITSRKRKHLNDPDVAFILGPLPWKIIRDYLYIPEGAESPEELQAVINNIFSRRGYSVGDDEEFYVHILIENLKELL